MEESIDLLSQEVDVPKTAYFEVNASLFEELGERLVSKPEVALAELIKNAYDADATKCSIAFEASQISIQDNGHGMTEHEFLAYWMVISTQEKGVKRFSRLYRRTMAGSKGVGRFSARFLGHSLELSSVADYVDGRKQLHATFDWKAITKEKTITTVKVKYIVQPVSTDTPCGTTLIICPLRAEAKKISLNRIKTDILRLTSPMSGLESPPFGHDNSTERVKDEGFSLEIVGETPQAQLDSDDESLHNPFNVQTQILDRYIGRVRVEINGDLLNYKVFWRGSTTPIEARIISLQEVCGAYASQALEELIEKQEDGDVALALGIPQIPVATGLKSPVFIDLRFFPSREGTFTHLGVNGKVAASWVRTHSGFPIIDNNFAMAAYGGDDNDWLGLNASKARNERNWQSIFTTILYPMDPLDKLDPARNPMLALPSGKQILGAIHISTGKPQEATDDTDDYLQPNMDRESLRDNGAYRLLWHIGRFAAELIALFDRRQRLQQEKEHRERAEKEAKAGLSKAILDIGKSPNIEPEYKNKIVAQLQAVQARYKETAEYEREARVSLELMSMMGVVGGFMTHEFEKAMHALSGASRRIHELARLDSRLDIAAKEIAGLEGSLAQYMDYMKVFINKARHPTPQDFKAWAQINFIADTLKNLSESHAINVDISVDKSLQGPFVPLAAYHGIVINLLSNAMKSLVPKISEEGRIIKIHAVNEGSKHILVCADNGIGIADYLRSRIWDPLFTTTSGDDDNPLGTGLGLGLSVVKRVIQQLKGSIELLDIAPPGYVTAFKVTLPLQGK